MNRLAIRRTAREWLKRLGLRGWTVDVLIVPHQILEDAHGPGVYHADVTPDPQHQRALIRVCRQQDAERLGLDPEALEETIVHELLHPRLDPMSHMANDSGFEIGLDSVAAELVRLARVERRKRPNR